ncbi:DUF7594 domain-containing protein, partial [Actinoplanes sp. NPDC049316]|uniref:CBM96 family carbohydrate-binding protein n=1 Tax=Actinoplanes sp. NPDC049316 TaxID=3154727 RepID=UPI0034493A57
MAGHRRTLAGASIAVTLVLGLAPAGVTHAATTRSAVATVRTYATDDAYTSSTRRAVNFGQADKLVVGRTGRETRMSYLKFTVRALPQGSRLTGAQLRLPLAGKPPASTLTLLRVPSTGWSEKTLTAGRAPRASTVVGTARLSTASTVAVFDVSKIVTRAGSYSFALRSSATAAVTRLRSVEYGHRTTGGPEIRLTVRRTVAAPAPAASGECRVDALLVPSCGVLWGAAAGGFTDTPRDQALKDWEALTGRTATIYHTYHKGNEMFPTKAEIAMTRDPARPRVLLL